MGIAARIQALPYLLLVLLAGGCGGTDDHTDLRAFIEHTQSQSVDDIEPLPVFATYSHFAYSAMALRSPFEPPFSIDELAGATRSSVEPDEDRRKELLESFNFTALTLRGSLRGSDGVVWALIGDGGGGIHRVTVGHYLGRNHGRIVAVRESRVEVIEIVPDGQGGWLERPRTLTLN